MITIPKQLQNPEFRFVLLGKKAKEPVEEKWQTENNYKFDDPKLISWIENGGNYGVIGGYGNLIIIDADSEEINEKCKLTPDTFTIKSCCPEPYKHHYYFVGEKELSPIRLSKEKVGDLGDIRSTGQYVVGSGCFAIEAKKGYEGFYTIAKDKEIAKINTEFLKSIFKDYIDTTKINENTGEKREFKIDTTKRLSQFTKNCRVPDYVLNNQLPENISKNWTLFPYVIDVLNTRDVSDKLYEKLAEMQNHSIGAVKGWVKSAKEGTLAKTSCKKMREYILHYIPELENEICEGCPLYENIKKEETKTKEEELKKKLLKEYKQKISTDVNVLEILKKPDLFNIIIKELDKKIEGEENSKKATTLSLCSVWIDGVEVPLNSLISSQSSAGKSFLCKNIIKIFPKEMVVYRTKISPEAFTYWHNGEEDWTWDGKILVLEDISQPLLDSPTFKVMCSEGSTASIVKNQETIDIEIKGKPVMLITTASTNPNAEILNRVQIVPMDESKQQTKAIVFRQAQQKNHIQYDENITNALRLLKRKFVYIPFAEKIAEYINQNYNFENLRLRRDFSRLLDLIKCSAVLHQYQRENNDNNELIATEHDYKIARECINYIQTQTFRGLTHKLKKAYDCCLDLKEFTASDIHSKFPFVNQKMWYNYLDDLLERNMLKTEIRKQEGIKEDGKKYVVKTTYYMCQEEQNFEMPEFDKLPNRIITNDTIDTNDTKVTKVTNEQKEEKEKLQTANWQFENPSLKITDCNDCIECSDKPHRKSELQEPKKLEISKSKQPEKKRFDYKSHDIPGITYFTEDRAMAGKYEIRDPPIIETADEVEEDSNV